MAAAEPPQVLKAGPVVAVGVMLVIGVMGRQFLAVSENRRLLGTVADQARHDPLTGLRPRHACANWNAIRRKAISAARR